MDFFEFIGDLLLSKLLWLTVAALWFLYYYLTLNDDYFAKQGVKFVKPVPLFGNMLSTIFQKQDVVEAMNQFYLTFPNEK